ncbi:ead/Ea22-like family protein [Salmonella enterica subsp. enterica]|nr:ead/Ea22-like family protein [Salmonella enterica subsp. enterica serovar Mikawasima]EEC0866695.1 ead/Ea22-like family protein [Salmonella enterica subsp. enterica serovar Mikawasima]
MNIDKQALREVAEKALPAMQRLLMMPNDELFDEAVLNVDGDVDAANAFNLSFGPETALALLDELECQQTFQQAFFRQSLMYDVVAEAYEEAKEQIAKDVEIKTRLCLESNNLFDRLCAAEKRIAELEARAFNPAILDVIAERQRQQSVEGWTPEHDDEHCNGELAMAAVCYINDTGTVNRNGGKPWGWPWDASWWKPDTRRRNLVKAGALILAEIERIDRAAGIKVKE